MSSFRRLFVPLISLITGSAIAWAELSMSPSSLQVYLLVGDTLTLSCSHQPGDGIDVSTVRFKRKDGYVFPPHGYVYPSKNVVQLQTRVMTANGNGEFYDCFINKSVQASTYVWVGDAPEVMSSISKWSNNLDNMAIQFCSNASDTTWSLSWTHQESRAHCTNKEVWHPLIERATSNTCHTCYLPVVNITFESTLYVCIVGENVLTDKCVVEPTVSKFKFQPLDIVKPGPVREKHYSNSTAVEISWKNPSKLNHSTFPLRYQVELRSEWNESFEAIVSEPKRYDHDVFSVVISDLSPYTEYYASIRAHPKRRSGYWSERQSFIFWTLESAPSTGPDIEEFSSSRDCDEAGNGNCRNVTIFWKELNARQRNGVIVGYTVTILPNITKRVRRSRVEATTEMLSVAAAGDSRSASIRLERDLDYRMQVLACTREGCSTPGKSFHIPSLLTEAGQEWSLPMWLWVIVAVAALICAGVLVLLIINRITWAREYFTLRIQVPERVVIGEAVNQSDYLLSGESSQGNRVGYALISEPAAMYTAGRGGAGLLATCSTDVEQSLGSVDRETERVPQAPSMAEGSRPPSTSAQKPMMSHAIDDTGCCDDVTSEGDGSGGYAKTMMQEVNLFDNVPETPASRVDMAPGSGASTVDMEMEKLETNADSSDYSRGFMERSLPVVLDTAVMDTASYQATGTSASEEEELGGSTDESATYAKVVESDCTGMQSQQEENRMESSLEEMRMESSLEENRMESNLEGMQMESSLEEKRMESSLDEEDMTKAHECLLNKKI